MRTRLRDLGVGGRAGPHVPRRRAAPAALLLAPRGGRRSRGRCCEHKLRLRRPGRAAGLGAVDRRGRPARPGRRDRVGQGQPRHRRRLRRRGDRRPAGPPRRSAGAGGRGLRRVRGAQEPRRTLDFDDLLLHTPAALEEHRRRRRRGPRAGTAASSSTSTRTSRRCSSGCSTPGSAAGTTSAVVGDANQTIYSFAGATPPLPAGLPPPLPRGRGRAAGPRLPLDPAGRGAGEPVIVGAPGRPPGPGCSSTGQRPAGPAADLRRASTTSRPRPPRSPTRCAALIDDGTPAAEIAVLFRINAQSEVYEQALSDAGRRLPGARRRAVLRAPRGPHRDPRCARLLPACAAPPAAASRRSTSRGPVLCAACCRPGMASPSSRPRGGAARERWESLRRAGRAGRRPGRQQPRRPTLGQFVAELDAARRGPAPADGAGRDAGLAALGEGPGVGRGVPRRPHRRHAADPARRRRRRGRWRRSAGCSTSASPGPARSLRCPGRCRAARAGGARGVAAASSTVVPEDHPAAPVGAREGATQGRDTTLTSLGRNGHESKKIGCWCISRALALLLFSWRRSLHAADQGGSSSH